MKIRPEQIQALSAAQSRDFEARAFEYLRTSHSNSPFIQEEFVLRALIREGIEKAASHGITREIDVIRFLELLATLGPNFDVSEPYASRLRRPGPAGEKLDEIVERIRFGDVPPE